MTGIIVQSIAEKIVNKGGGIRSRDKWITEIVPVQFRSRDGTIMKKNEMIRRRITERVQDGGSDYVIFNCAACGKRNRQVVYNSKAITAKGDLSFICNGCRIENEVSRPKSSLLVAPDSKPIVKSGLLGPDGNPIR